MTLKVYFTEDIFAVLEGLHLAQLPPEQQPDPAILESVPDEVKRYYRQEGFRHALTCVATAFGDRS